MHQIQDNHITHAVRHATRTFLFEIEDDSQQPVRSSQQTPNKSSNMTLSAKEGRFQRKEKRTDRGRVINYY
jgi:hypothetical protein